MTFFIPLHHPWETKLLIFQSFQGFIFWEKKCRNHFFIPYSVKNLKAKRNLTLLVASYSDFVSAYVILDQHLDISLRHRWN